MSVSSLYDRKYLWKCLLLLAGLCVLMRVTKGLGFAVVIPLIFFNLMQKKAESLFFWLLMTMCMMIANPNVITKSVGFFWLQRGLMLGLGACMAIQVFGYAKHRVLKPFVWMLAYIVFMGLTSIQGWCPIVSYLKLFLFTIIYFSFLGIANRVGADARSSARKIRSVLLTVAIFFVFGSLVLVPFPGLSQLKADDYLNMGMTIEDLEGMQSLFVGMTNHSQCLGPIISVISVVLWSDLLFSIKKFDSLYISMLLICPYLIYLTSSRTGMGAYLVGMAFVVFLFMRSRGIGQRWKSKVMSLVMFLMVLMLAAVACSSSLQDGISRFALKWDRDSTPEATVERMISTRQQKIDMALASFRKKPLTGNGFQVSETMQGLGLRGGASLLSAPVEKGVWVTAVLEEGGLFGWLIFVSFLCSCILTSIRRKAYVGASCLFVFMMTNFGEFTFFSMSYAGGFCWAMVFAGLALDMRKMRDCGNELRRRMIAGKSLNMV